MITLAQLSGADSLHVKDFLIISLALAMPIIAVAGLVFGGKRKIEPDPLRVQKVETLVTKDFCGTAHSQIHQRLDGHDSAIAAIRGELKADREHSESAARVRSAGIYNKLEDLRLELSDKMDAIRKEGKEDTSGVHMRINEVLSAVSELRGKISL